MEQLEKIDEVLNILNDSFELDPKLVMTLCRLKLPCSKEFGEKSAFYVHEDQDGDTAISPLGMLNAILEKIIGEKIIGDKIAIVQDEESKEVLGFIKYIKI